MNDSQEITVMLFVDLWTMNNDAFYFYKLQASNIDKQELQRQIVSMLNLDIDQKQYEKYKLRQKNIAEASKNQVVALETEVDNSFIDKALKDSQMNYEITKAQLTGNKFNVIVAITKQFMEGSAVEKEQRIHEFILSFFREKVGIDPQNGFFCQRIDHGLGSNYGEVYPNKYLVYGADFFSTKRLHNRFRAQLPKIRWVDSSHCIFQFQKPEDGQMFLRNNILDFDRTVIIPWQLNRLVLARNWLQLNNYYQLFFYRRLFVRNLTTSDEDYIKSLGAPIQKYDAYHKAKQQLQNHFLSDPNVSEIMKRVEQQERKVKMNDPNFKNTLRKKRLQQRRMENFITQRDRLQAREQQWKLRNGNGNRSRSRDDYAFHRHQHLQARLYPQPQNGNRDFLGNRNPYRHINQRNYKPNLNGRKNYEYDHSDNRNYRPNSYFKKNHKFVSQQQIRQIRKQIDKVHERDNEMVSQKPNNHYTHNHHNRDDQFNKSFQRSNPKYNQQPPSFRDYNRDNNDPGNNYNHRQSNDNSHIVPPRVPLWNKPNIQPTQIIDDDPEPQIIHHSNIKLQQPQPISDFNSVESKLKRFHINSSDFSSILQRSKHLYSGVYPQFDSNAQSSHLTSVFHNSASQQNSNSSLFQLNEKEIQIIPHNQEKSHDKYEDDEEIVDMFNPPQSQHARPPIQQEEINFVPKVQAIYEVNDVEPVVPQETVASNGNTFRKIPKKKNRISSTPLLDQD